MGLALQSECCFGCGLECTTEHLLCQCPTGSRLAEAAGIKKLKDLHADPSAAVHLARALHPYAPLPATALGQKPVR